MSRLGSLRRLLFAPRAFFRGHEPDYRIRGSILVALLTVLVTCGAVLATGTLVAVHVGATFADPTAGPHEAAAGGDLGTELRDRLYGQVPAVFLLGVLEWLLVGGVVHGFVRLLEGDAPVGNTFAVVGWGLLPSVVRPAAGVLAVHLSLRGRSLPAGQEAAIRELLAVVNGSLHPVLLAGAVVAAGWQAYIWAGGLQVTQDLRPSEAWFAAGTVALGLLAVGLL